MKIHIGEDELREITNWYCCQLNSILSEQELTNSAKLAMAVKLVDVLYTVKSVAEQKDMWQVPVLVKPWCGNDNFFTIAPNEHYIQRHELNN